MGDWEKNGGFACTSHFLFFPRARLYSRKKVYLRTFLVTPNKHQGFFVQLWYTQNVLMLCCFFSTRELRVLLTNFCLFIAINWLLLRLNKISVYFRYFEGQQNDFKLRWFWIFAIISDAPSLYFELSFFIETFVMEPCLWYSLTLGQNLFLVQKCWDSEILRH